MITDEQIHAVYEEVMGQPLRERDAPMVKLFARAVLLEARYVDKSEVPSLHEQLIGVVRHEIPLWPKVKNTKDRAALKLVSPETGKEDQ